MRVTGSHSAAWIMQIAIEAALLGTSPAAAVAPEIGSDACG
jgi:hypothetical protein